MFGKVMYGALLYTGLSWRWIPRLAAVICVIGALASRIHKDSHHQADVQREASVRDIFDRTINICRRKRFWKAAGTIMLLTVLKKSGQLIPLYFVATSSQTLVNDGTASWLGTIFQCGLLLGIFAGGKCYNAFSDKGKRLLCGGLLFLSASASVGIVLVGIHETDSITMLLFRGLLVVFFAVGVGLSYYIPIGIFVIRIGKEDTATVSALMDIVGYLFGSLFFIAVLTPMVDKLGWTWVWIFYAGMSLLSAAFGNGFLHMLHETDWANADPEYVCGGTSTSAGEENAGSLTSEYIAS